MAQRIYRLVLFAAVALVPAAAWAQPMTVDEVVKLLDNDISDNIITARIEETGSYFSLSTDDLIELKDAGASDELVRYMIMRKPGGRPPRRPGTAAKAGSTLRGGSRAINRPPRPASWWT